MGLSRSKVPFEEDPPSFCSGETGQDSFEVFMDLFGDYKSLVDHPAEVRIPQVIKLDDGLDFRDLDEVSDRFHSLLSEVTFSLISR